MEGETERQMDKHGESSIPPLNYVAGGIKKGRQYNVVQYNKVSHKA